MSDCFCDYDPPEFYSKARPIARKKHKCVECDGNIEPGQKYEVVSGKWDGYFDTFKTCERCCDLRQWVTNNLPCFCWAHGNIIEDAKTAVAEATWRASEETKGLQFGFLGRLHAVQRRENYVST